MKRTVVLLLATSTLSIGFVPATAPKGSVNGLRSLGYSLVPAARKVQLTGHEIAIDSAWGVEPQVAANNISARRLKEGALELHNLKLDGTAGPRIVLQVAPGTVRVAPRATADEAYLLKVTSRRIEITGNGEPGLFYGVQTLLQLLRPRSAGGCRLPEGEIEDWPALPLRFVHWDTKHHQDRPETLKRYIDWVAFFKANAIGFEIEDKYEFPRHPVVGAPGAFTKAEMQDLTRYALERHIQLVPQIQAPAHMAYVLKHDEFKHLRADGSNYQACMCDEEAISLIEDLYQDMIEVYRTLLEGARFYESSLDRVPANRLKPTYGSWAGPGRDTTRIDLRIEPPPLPFAYDETLVVDRTFSRRYSRVLSQMPDVRRRLDQVIGVLNGKLVSVSRNRYNLEVLLSIAEFERHWVATLETLAEVEDLMIRAAEAQAQERHRDVVSQLSRAHERVRSCLAGREEMWAALRTTWEKSRYPKGRTVGGRQFVHILDDLKDHRADRRAGLDYMLEPLENIGLEKWNDGLAQFIRTYARSRNLETPGLK